MTTQDTAQVHRDLEGLVGKTIRSLQRVFYAIGDVVERNEGPLQLEFNDGSVVLFQSGANGRDLTVRSTPWRDPFAGELSEENRAYVAEHGKWSLFDVSGEHPFADVCGRRVARIAEIHLKEQLEAEGFPVAEAVAEGHIENFGVIVGVLLCVDGLTIRVESIMDELRVDVTAGQLPLHG
ncbi:hypothetical protein [Mycolicibacterium stellerae]|uniref:hypothetical protein n=1 Tax=Mycolicibacterium stellerae TaxID=2358193 RepID=UPI000F0B3404|nr:hypothetical protein [Mycolicibacterium stellerae]